MHLYFTPRRSPLANRTIYTILHDAHGCHDGRRRQYPVHALHCVRETRIVIRRHPARGISPDRACRTPSLYVRRNLAATGARSRSRSPFFRWSAWPTKRNNIGSTRPGLMKAQCPGTDATTGRAYDFNFSPEPKWRSVPVTRSAPPTPRRSCVKRARFFAKTIDRVLARIRRPARHTSSLIPCDDETVSERTPLDPFCLMNRARAQKCSRSRGGGARSRFVPGLPRRFRNDCFSEPPEIRTRRGDITCA